MDLHPIRPGINFWSNWVEIHSDYIVCLPGRIGYHPNGFTPNLTSNLTGHEILVKMGVNSLRLHLYACLIKLGIIPVTSTQFEGGSNSIPPSQIRPVEFD